MIRPLVLSLAAALAFAATTLCRADETFPVVHREPISVRILSGKSGQPLAHLHLVLIGGYDQNDLHNQLFREDALSDAQGVVRLSKQLANLPWLQVWVNKKPLCQSNPRKTGFSVELIRRDGQSSPNLCGLATAEDAPGLFNVFVKGEAERSKLAKLLHVKGTPKIPAETALPGAAPAWTAPAQKPIQAQAALPTPQPAAPPVASVLLSTLAPAAAKTVMKTPPPVQEAAAAAVAAAAAPALIQAIVLPTVPAKAVIKFPSKSVAVRATAHRTPPSAYRAVSALHRSASAAHRARPVVASCSVDLPPVKAAPSEDLFPRTEARRSDPAKTARARARALGVSPKSKPPAGVKLPAGKPPSPAPPPKQE